jgi:hemoglobin-like flavoprotein
MSLNVELLEQTFQSVAPQADAFAASFYSTLFDDAPAAQPLFVHTDMNKQKKMLVSALAYVVENLRNPEALSETLQGLGARHVGYGALTPHYPIVGAALLKTLETYLGEAWTPAAQQAWTDAYGAVTDMMLAGAQAAEVKTEA